jgi:hypothetical protein
MVSLSPQLCIISFQRTIKYKSAAARDNFDFDFETLGAAIVGRSSPGILCLLFELATSPGR